MRIKSTSRLPNNTRLKIRKTYTLPKVPATKTPELDNCLKPELPQSTKVADRDMAKVQAFILDALAPLTFMVEADAKGDKVTHKQVVNATKTAIELIGNANAKVSHL